MVVLARLSHAPSMVVNHQGCRSANRVVNHMVGSRIVSSADRNLDRHAGKLRGVRFTDEQWERLGAVATYYRTSRTRLVADYGLYLIGELERCHERPPPGAVASVDDAAAGS